MLCLVRLEGPAAENYTQNRNPILLCVAFQTIPPPCPCHSQTCHRESAEGPAGRSRAGIPSQRKQPQKIPWDCTSLFESKYSIEQGIQWLVRVICHTADPLLKSIRLPGFKSGHPVSEWNNKDVCKSLPLCYSAQNNTETIPAVFS